MTSFFLIEACSRKCSISSRCMQLNCDNELKKLKTDCQFVITIKNQPDFSTSYIAEHLRDLNELKIIHSHIENLSKKFFKGLPNLKDVSLYSNKIHTIDDGTFSTLKKVEAIRLGFNSITKINKQLFQELLEIKRIHMKGNKISSVDSDAFLTNVKLETIDLSENRLKYLDRDLFKNLTRLKSLNLSHNELSGIDAELFLDNKMLSIVDLSHNHIKTIEWITVVTNQKLSLFNLNENICINITFNYSTICEVRKFFKNCKNDRSTESTSIETLTRDEYRDEDLVECENCILLNQNLQIIILLAIVFIGIFVIDLVIASALLIQKIRDMAFEIQILRHHPNSLFSEL